MAGLNKSDHNKLWTHNKLKGSFHCEPYIIHVRNSNQRCELTRLRCSASLLGSERMRYTRPVTPVDQRTCKYCSSYYTNTNVKCPVDDQFHFYHFKLFTNHLMNNIHILIDKQFMNLGDSEKFVKFLCPATALSAKLVDKGKSPPKPRFYHFIERVKSRRP